MQTFADLKGEDLHWVQPSLMSPVYELRTLTGAVVARVTRSGLINEVDHVEAAGGQYRIAHNGILNRWFEISAIQDGEGAPRYVYHHQGARLTLPQGDSVHWRRVAPSPISWAWVRASGVKLLELTCPGDKATAQIRLDLGAADPGTRLLLALLGAYLILLYHDEIE
jgi:hypothetical protein